MRNRWTSNSRCPCARDARCLPLREGTYHLALQAPHARPVDWRLLSAAPEAERRCKGALACAGDRLSPWPGAVVVSLEVEAMADVPLAG